MGRVLIFGGMILLGTLLGAASCAFASAQAKYGPYRGQIVDAETGKPIAGAVVLAVWLENRPNPVQGRQVFYDAREAVTDAEGRFEIPRLDVPFWKLGVQPGQITYFAPGYEPVAEVVIPPHGQLFIDPTVVKMRPIKTREEWCRYQWRLPPGMVPHDKMPVFLTTFRKEQRARGVCHYPIER